MYNVFSSLSSLSTTLLLLLRPKREKKPHVLGVLFRRAIMCYLFIFFLCLSHTFHSRLSRVLLSDRREKEKRWMVWSIIIYDRIWLGGQQQPRVAMRVCVSSSSTSSLLLKIVSRSWALLCFCYSFFLDNIICRREARIDMCSKCCQSCGRSRAAKNRRYSVWRSWRENAQLHHKSCVINLR